MYQGMEDLLNEEKISGWSVVLHAYSWSRRRRHMEPGSEAHNGGSNKLDRKSFFVRTGFQGDLTNNLTGANKQTYWPF